MSSRLLLAVTVLILAASSGRAHFLFVRVLPPAEGGRAAEVYFSEMAEAGDPRFVDKIAATTQLWLQTTPGKFELLKVHQAPDRLRAWLPYNGSLVVVGECRYGVIARPQATPFLLRHYPKGIAGNPDELNKLPPHGKLPLEIAVSADGDGLHLTALRNGKPLANAAFVTIDAQLNNVKFTADTDGKATWKPPTSGSYSIYTQATSKEAGELDGKKYEEIRDFATLAFTWPLERKDADAGAVARFQEALAARASWKKFPGFSARLTGNFDGRTFAGNVTVNAEGKSTFTADDSTAEAASEWVQQQFESIVLHRLARPTPADASKPVLRFGEAKDDHPFGQLLIFDGGQFASSYRVKDKQILVVNRHVGKENMTITVLDNDRNADGLFLPHSYTVQYWDAAAGEPKRTETVQQRWQRLGSWDLPAQHTVTTASASGLSVRGFTLTRHELAEDKPLKGAVIVVDPGHGGQRYSKSYTGGTRGVVSKMTESELNLLVAVELAKLLKEKGATVYLTREADHRLSPEGSKNSDELHARIDFFEHYNAHFFLSVHHNAGGGPNATGHTTLYKHNAKDDTLYESLATAVNDALEGVVPGPKNKLIKGSYHILRETSIPGTIAESGFMTNKEFDELSTKPDYPKKEAEAICEGAVKYWSKHKDDIIALRETLMKERAAAPRDPKTYTAISLNPDFQARMTKLVAQVAPDGKIDATKIDDYLANFKKAVVTDQQAAFTVKGEFDGKRIKLSGETSERKYHDQLIDLLVAMKLYNIANEIKVPKTP